MKLNHILVALIALMLGACATAPPKMYYWGNYSATLYNYKKEPSAETLQEHFESVQDVFAKSQEYGLRVPPSVHGDYGLLLLQSGKVNAAIEQFQLEKTTYPESTKFMDMMIQKATESKS